MNQEVKNILLTGFEPFHTYEINPSATVANHFNSLSLHGLKIDSLILPVSFENSFLSLETHLKKSPLTYNAIIMLGLSFSRNHISLELQAKNLKGDPRADNDGLILNSQSPIIEAAPERLKTSFNLQKIIDNEKLANFSHEISDNAGTYLCNFTYYQTLTNYHIPSLFIHLPATRDLKADSTFDGDYLINYIDLLLKEIGSQLY